MEKVLNQEEIDAMVRAARGGVRADGQQSHMPTVTAWDIRQAGQIGREQIRAIGTLHETFARNLTHALGAYLRVVFEVAMVSAEHLTYREYLQRMPEVTYMCSCALLPVEATALLQLDLSIAFPVIDLLLGGEGKSSVPAREITEIEQQILESVVQIICRELGVAWQALALEFRFDRRQPPAQAQRLMAPEEKTLSLSFEITMPEKRGTMNLAIPAVVSNALLRKISADWTYQKPRSSAESRIQVRRALEQCPFPVDLQIQFLRVPVRDLTALAPGHILLFDRKADAAATLSVGDRPLFLAGIKRHGRLRAAQLSSGLAQPEAPIRDARDSSKPGSKKEGTAS
jgi:flagellar motor switch protein FliM